MPSPGPAADLSPATHLPAVSQEVVAQGELLIGRAELLAPALDGPGGGLPQPLGRLPGRRQGLPGVGAQRELQEPLEVGHDQQPEQVGAGEELVHDLEGGEADLGVLLPQLGRQQVVGAGQLLLRGPGDPAVLTKRPWASTAVNAAWGVRQRQGRAPLPSLSPWGGQPSPLLLLENRSPAGRCSVG